MLKIIIRYLIISILLILNACTILPGINHLQRRAGCRTIAMERLQPHSATPRDPVATRAGSQVPGREVGRPTPGDRRQAGR